MGGTNTTQKIEKIFVAGAANECLASFQKCLSLAFHPKEMSMIEDQMARFSTWTSDFGVFAPGRASMDHLLHHDPEMQSTAISLLKSLNCHIGKCSDILFNDGQNPGPYEPTDLLETLQRSLDNLATEITHLNKMANVIRKAINETHLLRMEDFRIKDEDGIVVELELLAYYKRLIRDRFPTVSAAIQQRLAEAMIFRQKQILYKRLCYRDEYIQPQEMEAKVPIAFSDTHIRQEKYKMNRVSPHIESAKILDLYKVKMPSMPSFTSANITAIFGSKVSFPSALGLQTKRKYEQLRTKQLAFHQSMLDKVNELLPATGLTPNLESAKELAQERVSVQDQLRSALASNIQAIGETDYLNHVKNDLDPYVCLFQECNQPDGLYKHSEDWLSHMRQHSQCWRCSSHRELGSFSTREKYMQHMRYAHDPNLSESKLHALAKRNARGMPKLFSSCPLCGKDESGIGARLVDHIAGHLKSLAIESLPSYKEDIGDMESEDDSSEGIHLQRKGTFDLLDDEAIHGLQPVGNQASEATEPGPGESFNSPHRTRRHSGAGGHSLGTGVYQCNDCNQTFDQPHKLQYVTWLMIFFPVLFEHHQPYHIKNHKCPYQGCSEAFGNEVYLQKHIDDTHEKKNKLSSTNEATFAKTTGLASLRNWKRNPKKTNYKNYDALASAKGTGNEDLETVIGSLYIGNKPSDMLHAPRPSDHIKAIKARQWANWSSQLFDEQ
ncbi:hypothetical protein V8C43DRAFT_311799 [Trichoderma afarasin]